MVNHRRQPINREILVQSDLISRKFDFCQTPATTKMKEAKTKIKTSKLWFSTLMKSIKKWQITNMYPSMTIKTNKRGMLWARGCHLDEWSFIIVSYFSCDDANCDDCDKQVNTYCGSLVAGLGGSGDRERKWEEKFHRQGLKWSLIK